MLELEEPEQYIVWYKVSFVASEPQALKHVMVKEEIGYRPIESGARYRYT